MGRSLITGHALPEVVDGVPMMVGDLAFQSQCDALVQFDPTDSSLGEHSPRFHKC